MIVVLGDGVVAYPNLDSKYNDKIELKKGEKLQVVQPLVCDEKSKDIKVIINESKHYKILTDGIVLMPKEDTFMHWGCLLLLGLY